MLNEWGIEFHRYTQSIVYLSKEFQKHCRHECVGNAVAFCHYAAVLVRKWAHPIKSQSKKHIATQATLLDGLVLSTLI